MKLSSFRNLFRGAPATIFWDFQVGNLAASVTPLLYRLHISEFRGAKGQNPANRRNYDQTVESNMPSPDHKRVYTDVW